MLLLMTVRKVITDRTLKTYVLSVRLCFGVSVGMYFNNARCTLKVVQSAM